jgi:predicted RecB family nuclease
MKNLINITLIIFLAASTTFANNPVDSTLLFTASKNAIATTGAFGEVVGAAKSDAPEYIRGAKALTEDFTGYKIELVTVFNAPLSLNDELFKTFGGISVEKRTDNSYTYLLGGNFDDKKAIEAFLNDVVKAKYPNAKGVKYNKGNVVKFK